MKFSPLSLMSLNPIKVPEFLNCSLKFIERLNGAPEKKKTYAICTKTNFPLLQLKHDLFKNVIFRTLSPLYVVYLE